MLSSAVYPGDTPPTLTTVKTFEGSGCRLSDLNCCVHNGTHIDAPCHFAKNGCGAADIPLEKCFGKCAVVSSEKEAIEKSSKFCRILIRGGNLTLSDAQQLCGVSLLGIESQSFGKGNEKAEVHRILLERGVVLLEGIDLSGAADGEYILSALPLKINGSDGTPVRAALVRNE